MAVVFGISYKKNDGSSTELDCEDVSKHTVDYITSVGQNWGEPPQNWSRDGYSFEHWNTAADDSGTSYNGGDLYTGARVTLYAIWQADTPVGGGVSVTLGNTEIASLSNTGSVTLATAGTYVDDDITIGYTKSGGGTSINLQSKTAASTGVEQTITADSGYDGLSSVTVSPVLMGVIRPNAEKVKTYTYNKLLVTDENATIPTFNSSSQTTFHATASLSDTYTIDLSNYDYYILERFATIPIYSSSTKGKGRQDYHVCTALYEIVNIPGNSFQSQSGTKYATAVNSMTAVGAIHRIVYWTNASAISVGTTSSYGFNQIPVAPVLSGSTITMSSPDCKVRGSNTYLSSTYYGYVTDVRAQYVFEIYRVPKITDGVNGWGVGSQINYIAKRLPSNNWTL